MDIREQLIEKCFNAWIIKDIELFKSCFTTDIYYSECHGPEYHGINQIEKWFTDWNKHRSVLEWNIKLFLHQNNTTAVQWFFKCECKGRVSGFDGISIIDFESDNKIKILKEFQSKAEHYSPYE